LTDAEGAFRQAAFCEPTVGRIDGFKDGTRCLCAHRSTDCVELGCKRGHVRFLCGTTAGMASWRAQRIDAARAREYGETQYTRADLT
jgi:hypothetical protein